MKNKFTNKAKEDEMAIKPKKKHYLRRLYTIKGLTYVAQGFPQVVSLRISIFVTIQIKLEMAKVA